MKLRSGKEYLFIESKVLSGEKKKNNFTKENEKHVPNFVKSMANYLTQQFAYAGYEIYNIKYSVVSGSKTKKGD